MRDEVGPRSTLISARPRGSRDERAAELTSTLQPSEEVTGGDPPDKLLLLIFILILFFLPAELLVEGYMGPQAGLHLQDQVKFLAPLQIELLSPELNKKSAPELPYSRKDLHTKDYRNLDTKMSNE
ncbi:hypothetical protein EVAR_96220_1 [Eumeta japonica]|uniref:Uncharacterized protein n=1 Tax=Eumeta variegata TaxID=151549 RepID=A0A4C1WNC3_EUMVA|nr:hypothetical protein EVAR_96220_1 [Eumeta japonica]